MAATNVSSTELLGYVLKDLDEILSITKKVQKENSQESNVPSSTIGKVLESNGGINNIAAALNTVVSVKLLAKVKKSDIKHVADLMGTLATAIKNFQISEDDAKGFDRLVGSFAKITKVFSDLTDNTMNTFIQFSPLKGRILGKRLGSFYKAFMKGFESEKLGDFIKQFKDAEHLGNNLAGFSQLIATLFAVDWKQLLKIGVALKYFPDDAGTNLANFFKPIINVIKQLPGDHKLETINVFKKEESFVADGRIKSFMDLFSMFASIPLLAIKRIVKLGKSLNAELGKNISDFFIQIITLIKTEFKDNKTFKSQLKSFMDLFSMFASIPAFAVLRLALLGKVLNAELGKKIGSFFSSLINELNKSGKDKTENAQKTIKAFSTLLLSLTISFMAIVAMVMIAKPLEIAGALGVLTALTLGSYLLIKGLSDKKFQENSKEALVTIVSIILIMGAMTVVSLIAIKIGKNYKEAAIGLAAVVIMSGICLGLMYGLSKLKYGDAKKALKIASAISLSIVALTLSVLAFVGVTKVMKNVGWEEWGMSILATTILVAGMAAILWGLSKIPKSKMTSGIIGLTMISLACLGITLVMNTYAKYVQKVKNISWEEIWRSLGLAGLLITGVGGIMFVAGLLSGPQAIPFYAGLAAMGTISLAIFMITKSLTRFTDFILKTKKLTTADIENATSIIIGDGKKSLLGCLHAIIESMSKFGIWGSLKVRIIARNIMPIFKSLSSFVDVIQKMANMEIIDHYESKNGKQIPIYRKMTKQEFSNAATTLSVAFTEFMNQLYKEFNSPAKLQQIRLILNTFKKGSVGDLMNGVSSFANAITGFASLTVPDKWDANGNPTHYIKLSEKDFINAANVLASTFSTFIITLKDKLKYNEQNIKQLISIFGSKDENSFTNLIDSVSHAIDPLAKIASGKWNDVKITKESLLAAVDTLVDPIIKFVKKLNTNSSKIKSANKIQKKFTNITDSIIKVASNIAKINGEKFYKNTISFQKGSLVLFDTLNDVDSSYLKKAQIYKDTLVNMATGLNKLHEITSKSLDPFKTNAEALTSFDTELITQRDARNKAMTEITTNFQNMNEQVNKFNDGFRGALELLKKYLDAKTKSEHNMFKEFNEGTKQTFESVGSSVAKSVDKIGNTYNPSNNPNITQSPNSNAELVNAITGALAAWSHTSKNITLELSDAGVKAIGKVYIK